MDSFAAIVVLLMLFWVVFSIVGLHVFGGIDLPPPAWPNCDTLINCLILNFHVRAPAPAGQGNDGIALACVHVTQGVRLQCDALGPGSVGGCANAAKNTPSLWPRRSTWKTKR